MRMFVALTPSPGAVDHLDDFLEPRRDAAPGLRWSDPEQWHLTLAFLPDVPDRVLEPLAEALGGTAASHAPVELGLGGGGAFPHVGAARVLWAGVRGGVASPGALEDVAHLARGVRGAAGHEGAAPRGGPFHPHLTLARLRRPAELTRWVQLLDGYVGPTWRADEVHLIASHLGEGRGRRPRYEVVATLPLGPPAG